MAVDKSLLAFAREVNQPDHAISLARAALTLAEFEYPELSITDYLERFDALADTANRVVQVKSMAPIALASFLFEELGFSGNERDYGDPRNSFLNQVLERRLGIPITLSVVYLEVAQRLGLRAQGVGLPGHFIVCVDVGEDARAELLYLDPFHRGCLLSEEDCRAHVSRVTQAKLPFDPAFLNPVNKRYILTRMLNNLKGIYGAQQDLPRAGHVIERLLVLHPDDATEIRNLGLIYGNIGRSQRAVELLKRYLSLVPQAADRESIEQHMNSLIANISRLN